MYQIGQIFEDTYPMEAVEWCSENKCRIMEQPEKNGVRQFVIEEDDGSIPGESLAEAKQRAASIIDKITSSTILSGFDYNGYHFSYDTYDQLNFNQMAVLDTDPVAWSAYKNGNKVNLSFTRSDFLKLYAAGAQHKQKAIADGTAHKKELASCKTAKEVNSLLTKYYG